MLASPQVLFVPRRCNVTVLLVFIILQLVIYVHELGHYLAMRRYGVEIDEFSVGLGPTIWSHEMRQGGTFRFKLIPLGGYLRSANAGPATLQAASTWHRFVILMAGMFMNATSTFVVVVVTLNLFTVTLPYPFDGYVKAVGAPVALEPFVAAFLLSFGVWLATPFLLAKDLFLWLAKIVSTGPAALPSGPVDGVAGPIGIVDLGSSMLSGAHGFGGIVFVSAALFAILNVAVAGFNLLPILPLDGGQVARLVYTRLGIAENGRLDRAFQTASNWFFIGLFIFIIGNDLLRLVLPR
jgi:membrane-associated protease RseP (regulator of RpoE activity)